MLHASFLQRINSIVVAAERYVQSKVHANESGQWILLASPERRIGLALQPRG